MIEDPFGGALCLVLYGIFLARPFYRLNLVTLGDLFRNVFGPKVELISSLFMIISFFGYIAAQLVALGLLMEVILNIPMFYGILLSAAVVGFYTLAGGMYAISYTDFFQSIIIIAGLIWVAIKLSTEAGGIEVVLDSAPDYFYRIIPDGVHLGWLDYIGAWTVIGFGSLASQDVFQRVNAARNEKNAVLSTYLGAGMYLLFAMFPLFIALAAKFFTGIDAGANQQLILPNIVRQFTTLPVQILFFGALISAIFSTCSGAILAPASIISENLIRPLMQDKLSEKAFLKLLRWSVVFMTVSSATMAVYRNNIYELVAESSILSMVSLLVPMIAAVYFPKYCNSRAAIFSMFGGIFTWITFAFFIPTEFPDMLLGLAGSICFFSLGYFLKAIPAFVKS